MAPVCFIAFDPRSPSSSARSVPRPSVSSQGEEPHSGGVLDKSAGCYKVIIIIIFLLLAGGFF